MAKQKLARRLGLVEVIFFGTGSILGAGIYAIIGKVAGYGGNTIWISFAIASVTALMSAFSYAELSSMIPKAGAEYHYVKKAFNKKSGTVIGLIVSLTGIISGATVSLAFAGYLTDLLELPQFIAAVFIISLVWLVNSAGIRESSTVNIIFTIIEVSGLIMVLIAASTYFGKTDLLKFPEGGWNDLLTGAALGYFAFLGFEEIVKLSEETKKPEKNIPQALFYSAAIVMSIYMLISIAVISVIQPDELAKSSSPLSDVVEKGIGRNGAIALSIIALFSTTNTILSNMLGASRVLLELGDETKAIKMLSYISPKRKTPLVGLILVAGCMIAFAAIGNLETVALIANFFVFIIFLVVNAAVIRLRIKNPTASRPFRIPLNINNIPVPAILAMLLTLVLIVYSVKGIFIGE